MLVTVQSKVSVSSTATPSVTVTVTWCRPALVLLRVPLIRPVVVLMLQAVGQAGGGVGQRVAVGVGGAGVEAVMTSPSASVWSGRSWSKLGSWLVLLTVQSKVSVSSTS